MIVSGYSFLVVGATSQAFSFPPAAPGTSVQQATMSVTNLGDATVYVNAGSNLGVTATSGNTSVAAGATVTLSLLAGQAWFAAVSTGDAVPIAVAIGN
jgi:hypothetical protein